MANGEQTCAKVTGSFYPSYVFCLRSLYLLATIRLPARRNIQPRKTNNSILRVSIPNYVVHR